jgi:hypothetical protein
MLIGEEEILDNPSAIKFADCMVCGPRNLRVICKLDVEVH